MFKVSQNETRTKPMVFTLVSLVSISTLYHIILVLLLIDLLVGRREAVARAVS